MIKAIETIYKGYRFRSRLEARWAVYFDAINVKYEYERQGFEFDDGRRYLPDFWLPDFSLWVEVKGGSPNSSEQEACRKLSQGTDCPVWLVNGHPVESLKNMLFACDSCDSGGGIWEGFANVILCSAALTESNENVAYIFCDDERVDFDRKIWWCGHSFVDRAPVIAFGQTTSFVAPAARQARFEHGQVGAPHQWGASK